MRLTVVGPSCHMIFTWSRQRGRLPGLVLFSSERILSVRIRKGRPDAAGRHAARPSDVVEKAVVTAKVEKAKTFALVGEKVALAAVAVPPGRPASALEGQEGETGPATETGDGADPGAAQADERL